MTAAHGTPGAATSPRTRGAGVAAASSRGADVVLVTRLSVAGCRRRLDALLAGSSAQAKRQIVLPRVTGHIVGDRVRLRVRTLALSPFDRRLEGCLEPSGRGTRLVGRFRLPRVALLAATLWLAAAVVLGLGVAVQSSSLAAQAVALLVPAAGLGSFGLGRWLSRRKEGLLLDALATVLESRAGGVRE